MSTFWGSLRHHLDAKTFLGTSKNAVLTQLLVALCVYPMLAFLKLKTKIDLSMQQMRRLLQLNLSEPRYLMALLKPSKQQFVKYIGCFLVQ